MLDIALKRIKIPEVTRSFILEKREIEVLTNYGLTDCFQAQDGIDQGEVISLLVWKIFYDPLLVAIQKEKEVVYEIQVE